MRAGTWVKKPDVTARTALVFLPHNPVPPRSGAHVRMIETLIALRTLGIAVRLAACEAASENPWNDAAVSWLKEKGLCIDVAVFHEPLRGALAGLSARAWRHLRRSMHADKRGRFRDLTSSALRRWFRSQIAAHAPDCVLVNYAWFSRLVEGDHGARTVVETHDLVSLSANMRAAIERCIAPGVVFNAHSVAEEALDLSFYDALERGVETAEFEALERFDTAIAITVRDATQIEAHTRHTRVVAAPTPMAVQERAPSQGNLALFPMGPNPFNLQGYAWFMRKVLPRLRAVCGDFQLGVTGTFNRPLTLEYHPDVRNLGFVPDSQALWSMGCMLVNPVFGGTGQPIKTLEAMAAGLPPVILERFAHAAPIEDGVSGFVAADEKQFADCCVRLWQDAPLRARMGAAAAAAVGQACSREKFAGAIEGALAGARR